PPICRGDAYTTSKLSLWRREPATLMALSTCPGGTCGWLSRVAGLPLRQPSCRRRHPRRSELIPQGSGLPGEAAFPAGSAAPVLRPGKLPGGAELRGDQAALERHLPIEAAAAATFLLGKRVEAGGLVQQRLLFHALHPAAMGTDPTPRPTIKLQGEGPRAQSFLNPRHAGGGSRAVRPDLDAVPLGQRLQAFEPLPSLLQLAGYPPHVPHGRAYPPPAL